MQNEKLIEKIIDLAIEEDLATGDVTTDSIVPESSRAVATMTAKADGVISGTDIVRKVFERFSDDIVLTPYFKDGDRVSKGDVILKVEGSYPALLKGERTALNFFQRMSGIATRTAEYVEKLKGTHTRLLDTRKTAPGMRVTDKMAVKDGGGVNHRMGLYDMVMIKDNHIKMAGSISAAVAQVRGKVPEGIRVEVETESIPQVREALEAGADIIMFDNMSVPDMKEAVALIGGRAATEASGNMTLDRLAEVASTGVDFISVGALTHSVKAMDISMNIRLDKKYLTGAIDRLRRQKNAIVLAHYYTDPEIQDIADFVGDSLELSRKAAETSADIIVFCGVRFMAETAAVLSPDKTVLMPVGHAGCSLADGITGKALGEWRKTHPDGVVVSYVNTTADTKARTDICCTSANAVRVASSVAAAASGRPVLFAPDRNLGAHINACAGLDMELWDGCCHVHDRITSEAVLSAAERYPQAEILIHPEAACSSDPKVTGHPRCYFYSTSGIIRHAKESPCRTFIIATETGVLHRLRQEAPDKEFIPLSDDLICADMKKADLESLYYALEYERYKVSVPEDTASMAVLPVRKMMEL